MMLFQVVYSRFFHGDLPFVGASRSSNYERPISHWAYAGRSRYQGTLSGVFSGIGWPR